MKELSLFCTEFEVEFESISILLKAKEEFSCRFAAVGNDPKCFLLEVSHCLAVQPNVIHYVCCCHVNQELNAGLDL